MEGDIDNRSISAEEVATIVGVGVPLLPTVNVVGFIITVHVLVVGPSSAHDDNHYNQ